MRASWFVVKKFVDSHVLKDSQAITIEEDQNIHPSFLSYFLSSYFSLRWRVR